jgi:hypothetical protein
LALQNKGPICKARDEYLSNMEVRKTGRYNRLNKDNSVESPGENIKSK